MARKQRQNKEPLDERERREWKSWLKTQHSKNEDHGIQSHHFTANRWGKNGNGDRLYYLGFQKSLQKVTAAMKLKHLLPGRKVMTNLDSILKTWDINITLPAKVHLVKAMVFPVVMYRCESWTKKRLSTEECGTGEDSWESLELQGDQTSQS